MRVQIAQIICVLLMSLGSASGENRVLPMIDKSAPGSPLENTGSVTLTENLNHEDKVVISHSDDWTVKNISGKPIVALVETLIIQDNERIIIDNSSQYDAFFHPQLMDSGQTISFSKELELSARYVLDSAPASPSCQVIVRWVQFADGSTFGDSTFAKELFADRAAILQGLRRLRDAYVNGGSEKFVEQLQERLIRPTADAYIGHIRDVQQKHGTEAAIVTLTTHLTIGEERTKLFERPQ